MADENDNPNNEAIESGPDDDFIRDALARNIGTPVRDEVERTPRAQGEREKESQTPAGNEPPAAASPGERTPSVPKGDEPPAATGTPAKKFAGRYETVEEMEEGARNGDRRITELAEANTRLEKLLEAAIRAPRGAEKTDAPPAAQQREVAKVAKSLRDWASKAGIGEDVEDGEFIEALVPQLLEHPTIEAAIADRIARGVVTTLRAQNERDQLRSGFFEKYPEVKDVPENYLKMVMEQAESSVASRPEAKALTRDKFIEHVLDETATRAREIFRLQPKAAQPAPGNGNGTPPPARREKPPGVFSESGSPRPSSLPELAGQDKEIADIFDR